MNEFLTLNQSFPNFFSLLPNLTLGVLLLSQNVNIYVYGCIKTLDIFFFVTPSITSGKLLYYHQGINYPKFGNHCPKVTCSNLTFPK